VVAAISPPKSLQPMLQECRIFQSGVQTGINEIGCEDAKNICFSCVDKEKFVISRQILTMKLKPLPA
jgi:hypothetical protein